MHHLLADEGVDSHHASLHVVTHTTVRVGIIGIDGLDYYCAKMGKFYTATAEKPHG
jgi:hypothetical protein